MENKDFTQKQMLLKQSIINFITKHDVVINYSSLPRRWGRLGLKDPFNSLPKGLAAKTNVN